MRLPSKVVYLWVLIGLLAMGAAAQTPPGTQTVPILSGSVAFVPTVGGGETSLNAVVAPVVLVPFGEKWLLESRATFEGEFERENGSFVGPAEKQVDYLELDYLANQYLTVTLGRFLTPFGIYNERIYPVWVRNLQAEPFILSFEESSGNGAMLRGGFSVSKAVVLNYATYFSALTTNEFLYADRAFGTRAGVFLAQPRIEAGFSFRRKLQGYPTSFYGAHFVWQPRRLPLDVRTEFVNSSRGRGYWIEPAYRLSSLHKLHALTSKTQFVGRLQQFFPQGRVYANRRYDYPTVQATRAELGLNYYLMDGLRVTGSSGRQFSSEGDYNVWTLGMTYRFAFPLGPGGAR